MTTRILGFAILTTALVAAASGMTDSGSPAAQAGTPAVRSHETKAAGDHPWPPRTPDGQPDIQGVWANPDTGVFTHSLESKAYLATQGEPTITMTTTSRAARGVRPKASATTYIVDPPDGVLPYQPWALERRNSAMKGYTRPERWDIDPETLGWPSGVPRIHVYSSPDGETGGPWQVLQGPGYVLFLYETQHEFRYVPIGPSTRDARSGQAVPPQPGSDVKLWMGASRGRWEGTTLVIESTNHNDSTRFDIVGDFHSDAMRVTERFTFVDLDTIDYRATIDDATVYTRPWTIAFRNTRTPPGTELIEYAGVEGETAVTKWLPK